MQSSPTTPTTTTSASFASSLLAPVASNQQHENKDDNEPHTTREGETTGDFFLGTLFNHQWLSGPNVLSFNEDGTVTRPKKYAMEPYPGYHSDHRRAEQADTAIRNAWRLGINSEIRSTSRSRGLVSKDTKPWKNIAITEQDDVEFEMMMAIEELVNQEYYGYGYGQGYAYPHGQSAQAPYLEQPQGISRSPLPSPSPWMSDEP